MPISIGTTASLSFSAGNVNSRRMTPLSHLKAFARRFSSGTEPHMDAQMHSVHRGSQVHRAFIALGSNVGDRVEMIERACLELDRANIKVKRTSSLFETTPMYVLEQDTFINGVCEVNLPLSAFHLIVQSLIIDRWKPHSRRWSFWMLCNPSRMPWAERS